MMDYNHIQGIINDLNVERKATFAEFLAAIFKDRYIEIYVGDTYEEVSVEQISTPYASTFCGKVISAYKECLVIQAISLNRRTKVSSLGNFMFINERSIRALCELDEEGLLSDMFLKSLEALQVKDNVEAKRIKKITEAKRK